MNQPRNKPGRPRDPQADTAILAAARDLMAEGGLSNLTVEGTAQRAGVAKTTVYRRYPSKLILAVAALAALLGPPPEGDSLDEAVRDSWDSFHGRFGSATGQVALLSVSAAAATDPQLHLLLKEQVLDPTRERVIKLIEEGSRRGDASSAACPDFVYDVLVGTLVHRAIIRQLPPDEDFFDRFAALSRYVYQAQPEPCQD